MSVLRAAHHRPTVHQVADEFVKGFGDILVNAAGGPVLEYLPAPLRDTVPSASVIRDDIRQMSNIVLRYVLNPADVLRPEVYEIYAKHNPRRFYAIRNTAMVALERTLADHDISIMTVVRDHAKSLEDGIVTVGADVYGDLLAEGRSSFAAQRAFVQGENYELLVRNRLLKPLYALAAPIAKRVELATLDELDAFFTAHVRPEEKEN